MVVVTVIAQTTGVTDATEQERLKLAAGDLVLRLRRVWTQDELAICYEVLVLPLEQFPGLVSDHDVTEDIVALAGTYGMLRICWSHNRRSFD